ncbi:cardiotrophin-2-like [Pelobates fuscus]|uniref:cardiotrophin-2-like n=1 Tax=Pelobates fuscus TaxID=191477 RepID=UPI002FE4547A
MEILNDHLLDILSIQEEDGKENKRQALRLVVFMRAQSDGLVKDYLHFQGAPLSNPDFNQKPQTDGLPTLEELPASPWKRLSLSLSAFASLASWFESVIFWQTDLNPKAKQLHKRLETCHQQLKALCSSLATILGRADLSYPSTPTVSKTFAKKIAGYAVCVSFINWLQQTERDLAILIAETAV